MTATRKPFSEVPILAVGDRVAYCCEWQDPNRNAGTVTEILTTYSVRVQWPGYQSNCIIAGLDLLP